MRNRFVKTLLELSEKNGKVYLITGDLGYNVLTPFQERYPDRYINGGIAEQNMTGVAAGIALMGYTVFTYSIANFPTLRCLEQIRNDVAYHRANVKIVSIGAGFGYGSLGMSHHATEDVAIMRALPEMIVCSPGDPIETQLCTKIIFYHQGPCYLRLGKGGEKEFIDPATPSLDFGKCITIKEGISVALYSSGPIMEEAVNACEQLNDMGISTGLYSFPFVKPIDEAAILRHAKTYDMIVTIEEHNVIGGFSGAVAEVMTKIRGPHAFQVAIGLDDQFASIVGSQKYLREKYGINSSAIVNKVMMERENG